MAALPRERTLEKRYGSLDALPLPWSVQSGASRLAKLSEGAGIATPASPPPQQQHQHPGGRSGEDGSALIEQVFKDERINLTQKENIARSILRGDFDVGDSTARPDGTRPGRIAAVHDLDLARGEGLLRRHKMKKPRFIELDGSQAPILLANPSDLIAQEQAKRRSKERKTGFFLFNQYLPEEKAPIRPGKSQQSLEQSKSMSDFAQVKAALILETKLNAVKKVREEVGSLSEKAAAEKRRFQEKMEQKKELRKKIEQLRSKVFDRLTEKKDPLAGRIIRALDDKLALAIMQHYKGFTMSADAVIALVGTSLGAVYDSKDAAVIRILEETESAEGGQSPVLVGRPYSANAAPFSAGKNLEQVFEKMPFTSEYPMNGRTFGSRATHRTRPETPPPVLAVEGGPDATTANSPAPASKRSSSPPNGRGWNANTPSLQRKGAGFNVYSRGDPLTGKELAGSELRLQSGVGGRDNNNSRQGESEFPIQTTFGGGLISDSIVSTADGGGGEEIAAAHRAIDAIIDEMRGQGTLPSMQPERVLSDKQLEKLGTHETTLDSIAREIKWQRQKKSQKLRLAGTGVDTQTFTLTAGSEQQPPSNTLLSMTDGSSGGSVAGQATTQWSMPNLSLELGFQPRPISESNYAAINANSIANRPTPSDMVERITNAGEIKVPRQLKTKTQSEPLDPFGSWDVRQKILSRGIPAGVGLPLWTGSRAKDWGARVKTPDGRFVAGTGSPDKKGKASARSKMQMFN